MSLKHHGHFQYVAPKPLPPREPDPPYSPIVPESTTVRLPFAFQSYGRATETVPAMRSEG